MGLKGTQTERNILTAFAGESQARNRYDMFARQASKEGFEQIAEIFAQTAEHERQHAKQLFSLLEGGEVQITAAFPAGVVGSTLENLKAAAAGEHYENSIMYPEFAKVADKEGLEKVAALFRLIMISEIRHENRYLALARNIEDGKVFTKDRPVRWVCRKCGYVHEGISAPKVCPLCQHPQAYFELDQANY
ncbi:MAG: rubrerythrin family protein [Sedimentisphaerales bacterium]|nr:rubrerythrin family protein [Sedimentisphaerales bacterium]